MEQMQNQRINDLGPGWIVLLVYNSQNGLLVDDEDLDVTDTTYPIVCGGEGEEEIVFSTKEQAENLARNLSVLFNTCTYIVCHTGDIWGPDVVPLDFEVRRAMKSLQQVLDAEPTNS
jgi:hypothetical protein